jgi:hypothetical protein
LLKEHEFKSNVHHQHNAIDDLNKIKIRHSRGESILPKNTFNPSVGSYAGVHLNSLVINHNRYLQSKELVLPLDKLERQALNAWVEKAGKLLQRRSLNFGLKGGLGLIFVNTLLNRFHKQDEKKLQRAGGAICPKYMILSFTSFVGSLALL